MPVYLWTFTVFLKGGNTIIFPVWTWEITRKGKQLSSFSVKKFPLEDSFFFALDFDEVQAVFVERERELTEDELPMINEGERLKEERIDKASAV